MRRYRQALLPDRVVLLRQSFYKAFSVEGGFFGSGGLAKPQTINPATPPTINAQITYNQIHDTRFLFEHQLRSIPPRFACCDARRSNGRASHTYTGTAARLAPSSARPEKTRKAAGQFCAKPLKRHCARDDRHAQQNYRKILGKHATGIIR